MAKTTAEVIREITINHLSSNEGLLFGQSLKGAVPPKFLFFILKELEK